MKTQFNEEQLQEISALQEKFNITRKSAIRRFEKAGKKIVLTAEFSKKNEGVTVTGAAGVSDKTVVVVPEADFKSRAANDDTNLTTPAATEPAKTEAPKTETPKPSTPAGDARKEGIRLFQLAGKPSKQDFIHVYGEMGAKWTWPARAKAVGLTSGEEAAKQFQAMRAKPAGSCLVQTEEKKEEPKTSAAKGE